jgi:hypothetical protein
MTSMGGHSKRCESPMMCMLIGRGVAYKPLSLLADQSHDMHVPIYWSEPGSRSQAYAEGIVREAIAKLTQTHGGTWATHWASVENETQLVLGRILACKTVAYSDPAPASCSEGPPPEIGEPDPRNDEPEHMEPW